MILKTAIQEIKYASAMIKIKTDTTEKGVVRHTFERFPGYGEKGLRYKDDDSKDEHERLTRADLIDK